jgi:hypothetical protein
MQEEEYQSNSKRMALWMISIVVGVIIFLSPMFFVPPYIQPILVLFAFGGIFIVLYASVRFIFGHSYKELIIGAAACWFIVALVLAQTNNTALSTQTIANFNFYFAVLSIMIISSFTGLALLFNSANESNAEFMNMVKRVESNEAIARLNKEQIRGIIKKSNKTKS